MGLLDSTRQEEMNANVATAGLMREGVSHLVAIQRQHEGMGSEIGRELGRLNELNTQLAKSALETKEAIVKSGHEAKEAIVKSGREMSDAIAQSGRETVGAIEEMRDELSEGLSALTHTTSLGFSNLRASLDDGFNRLETQLKDVNIKSGWTDSYKRFASFKKNAFDLARKGDYKRSVEQGLPALSFKEVDGSYDDNVQRDPELNALLAGLFVNGLATPPPDGSVNPFELAHRAFEKGNDSEVKSEKQAAADGAHLLAIAARRMGDFENGEKLDAASYELEQYDDVAALGRYCAAAVHVSDTALLGRTIALASIVHPRFAVLWMSQPALLLNSKRTDEVLAVARKELFSEMARANDALVAQEKTWQSVLQPLPGVKIPLLHKPRLSEDSSLVALSACVRATYTTVLTNDQLCYGWLFDKAKALGIHASDHTLNLKKKIDSIEREYGERIHSQKSDLKKHNDELQGMVVPSVFVAVIIYFIWGLWSLLVVVPILIKLAGHFSMSEKLKSLDSEKDELLAKPVADHESLFGNAKMMAETLMAFNADLFAKKYLDGFASKLKFESLRKAEETKFVLENVLEYGNRIDATSQFWLAVSRPERIEAAKPMVSAYVTMDADLKARGLAMDSTSSSSPSVAAKKSTSAPRASLDF